LGMGAGGIVEFEMDGEREGEEVGPG
jgi:hypothetical protein